MGRPGTVFHLFFTGNGLGIRPISRVCAFDLFQTAIFGGALATATSNVRRRNSFVPNRNPDCTGGRIGVHQFKAAFAKLGAAYYIATKTLFEARNE